MKPSLQKQPKGLYTLFFTEMWERFGFYTLQAIIVLYLTKQLLFSDHKANMLYAAFSSLLFATPVIGGFLADRFLGFRRAIILGGVLLLAGYILIALPGEQLFYLGLSVLICGSGLLKPNISGIVGRLYVENDPRREPGFTIFYMGINIGSLLPPLIAGSLVAVYGWHAGFSLAAIGMAIGLFVFIVRGRSIRHLGEPPKQSYLNKSGFSRLCFNLTLVMGICVAIVIFYIAMLFPEKTDIMVELFTVVVVVVVAVYLFKQTLWRNRMLACLILILISIGFWALYAQTFSSLMLFSERNLNRTIFGIHFKTEVIQSFNPMFIILLSPIFSQLWFKLGRRNKNPGVPLKFSLGILFMCAGFALLYFATGYFSKDGMVSTWWLIASFLLQTIGELLLSPIGLSMITTLCPANLVGMMMGVWFFAFASAFALGGFLATLADVPAGVSRIISLTIYHNAYFIFALFCFILAVGSLILMPFLNRLIASDKGRILYSAK